MIGNFSPADMAAATAAEADTQMAATTPDAVTAADARRSDATKPSTDAGENGNESETQATNPDSSARAGGSAGAHSLSGGNADVANHIKPAAFHNETPRFTTGTVTLPANAPLWRQLDDMKQQMQGALEEQPLQEKIVVGAAKGATLIAFAGTVNWVLKGSNIIAGVLSSLPLWTQFDPLAVLTLTRRERKRRKEERRADARRDDAEYSKLGSLLERRLAKRKESRS
jgi:hypothetical protein